MAEAQVDETLDHYRTSVILTDGTSLQLRPIRRDDEQRLLDLFYRLSSRTIYLRFHYVLSQMTREEAQRYCAVDSESRFALVGTLGEGAEERIIAVGRYERPPMSDVAEVAFLVEDPYQGKGLGTHLLEQLAVRARERGIRSFQAEVLAENADMMGVFRDSGFHTAEEMEHGVFRVVLDILPTPVVEERFAEREKVATIASMKAFLEPHSIAVIGASRRSTAIGYKLFRNILYNGFQGVGYPVNPNAEVVASVKTYPSVLDIPGDVELAVIVVPADMVHNAVQQCGRKHVRGMIVITAGFGETGPAGKEKEQAILETARSYGMRMVGPNCMGIINTHPDVSMNATFSSVFPPSGNIAMSTQSGALGLAILEYAQSLNVGLSTFVSTGNGVDVSAIDLLLYWEQDPATDVILLYMESFGSPRRFARVARSVAAVKPVVALKSGRTAAGVRAAASHTGALATTEVAAEALFRQAGMIRVDTLEELFDVANFLSHQPVPKGGHVAILSNGGGPAIMAADACAGRGLELPTLAQKTVDGLRSFLPAAAAVGNPIDMTAEARDEEYGKALKYLAEDERIDSVIVIFVPPVLVQPEAVAGAIRSVAPEFRKRGKPLVASFMGSKGVSSLLGSKEEGYVPSFVFPESGADALAKAYQYGQWLRRSAGSIPKLSGMNPQRADQLLESGCKRDSAGHNWLDPLCIFELLSCYDIQMVQPTPAHTPSEAARAARDAGFPVVIKLLSDTITHKTEVGGVKLDLRSEDEVEEAFHEIKERLARIGKADEMQGVLVQKMVSGGVEMIVGVSQDPAFGPLILLGMGGIYTELFQDVAFRIHPLTDVDAQEMVRSIKAYRLLTGFRGAPLADVKALEDLLLRVSAMVEDLPQIVELDLNPVKVLERDQGYVVVDARIRLAVPPLT